MGKERHHKMSLNAAVLIFLFFVGSSLAACPRGGLDGSTGKCYFGVTFNQTFNKAEHFCDDYFYGNLVSIHNGFDNRIVLSMAMDLLDDFDIAWIGGEYNGQTIEWNDHSIDDYHNFENDNVQPGSLTMNLNNGKWSTSAPKTPLPFICQMGDIVQSSSVPSTTHPTVPPTIGCPKESPCPTEWYYASQTKSCYKLVYNVAFDAAESRCNEMGSKLASIHSDEENRIVNDFAYDGGSTSDYNAQVLIGGQRTGLDPKDWKWFDNTPWNYTAWAPGEPNNGNHGEYCVETSPTSTKSGYRNKWNDYSCSSTYRAAVCKQPAKF